MSPRIILYSADHCPFAHRARVALTAAGADFEIVEIDLKNKPEWYPRVNPATKVPAIWYNCPQDAEPSNPPEGTFILPESSLIVEFLADIYPQIADKDPLDRARAAYIATLYDPVFSAWFGYAKSAGGKDVKEFENLVSALRTFAKSLPKEYATREGYNTADILLGPMISQLSFWPKHNVPAWPNQNAGKDLLEALEAPEFETLKKYQEKLANWSAVTTTRNNENLPKITKMLVSSRSSQ